MIRRESPALCGRRIDWLSVAFRVRFPEERADYLKERGRQAVKHGRAGVDLGGELWDMGKPKGFAWWLESEARGERLEIALAAPGAYVSPDGEVVPGFTMAVHASGVGLAFRTTREAVRRAWRIAERTGRVYEARLRRVDVTADFVGVLVDEQRPDDWLVRAHVGRARELERGDLVREDRHVRGSIGTGVVVDFSAFDSAARAGRGGRLLEHAQLELLAGQSDDRLDVRAGRGSERARLRQDGGARLPAQGKRGKRKARERKAGAGSGDLAGPRVD